MKKLPTLFLILFLFALSFAQSKPASADDVMKKAVHTASASHKQILLIFHASWCKWCKKLDSLLIAPKIAPVMKKYFVITHLDVMERNEKIAELENPGGIDVMKKYGGENSGLPFSVILNAKQEMITNSNAMPDNSNLGYPAVEQEIALFAAMIKKGAPKMKDKEIAIITEYLKAHAPKH